MDFHPPDTRLEAHQRSHLGLDGPAFVEVVKSAGTDDLEWVWRLSRRGPQSKFRLSTGNGEHRWLDGNSIGLEAPVPKDDVDPVLPPQPQVSGGL